MANKKRSKSAGKAIAANKSAKKAGEPQKKVKRGR